MQTGKKLLVGKMGAVFGIKGWIKVISYTEPATNILNYFPWQLRMGNKIKPIKITSSKIQDKQIIVQIEDCMDRDVAKQYTNAEIVIEREQLADLKQEYYWADLMGMQVMAEGHVLLGKVDHLLETGSNDVLVVEGEKKYLIPFLPEQVILKIDMENNTIFVNWDPEF